jgi:hypothetical protein
LLGRPFFLCVQVLILFGVMALPTTGRSDGNKLVIRNLSGLPDSKLQWVHEALGRVDAILGNVDMPEIILEILPKGGKAAYNWGRLEMSYPYMGLDQTTRSDERCQRVLAHEYGHAVADLFLSKISMAWAGYSNLMHQSFNLLPMQDRFIADMDVLKAKQAAALDQNNQIALAQLNLDRNKLMASFSQAFDESTRLAKEIDQNMIDKVARMFFEFVADQASVLAFNDGAAMFESHEKPELENPDRFRDYTISWPIDMNESAIKRSPLEYAALAPSGSYLWKTFLSSLTSENRSFAYEKILRSVAADLNGRIQGNRLTMRPVEVSNRELVKSFEFYFSTSPPVVAGRSGVRACTEVLK